MHPKETFKAINAYVCTNSRTTYQKGIGQKDRVRKEQSWVLLPQVRKNRKKENTQNSRKVKNHLLYINPILCLERKTYHCSINIYGVDYYDIYQNLVLPFISALESRNALLQPQVWQRHLKALFDSISLGLPYLAHFDKYFTLNELPCKRRMKGQEKSSLSKRNVKFS